MDTTQKICLLFGRFDHQLLSHSETRTSEESFKVRAEAGFPTPGAKAILMRMEKKQGGDEFNVLVLPADKKVNSKALKQQLDYIKSCRFATLKEMDELTNGLVPGSMPPFARVLFPTLDDLFIDSSLLRCDRIGFNAASLTQSLIVRCEDYIQIAQPTTIFPFST